MNWFKDLLAKISTSASERREVPEGLWEKCPSCNAMLYRPELERNLLVCPKCGQHLRINARKRLKIFLDEGSSEELFSEIAPIDRLKFKDTKRYKDRLETAQKATGEKDALLVFSGKLFGIDLIASSFDFSFIGGSMGAVVGEKFAKAVDLAIKRRVPFVNFAASGGARMQEGLTSLMQMAKTSTALAQLAEAGLPYISVLTDPTTGGVSASLAMLGDVIIAEPNATIGFAGRRVIEQTVRQQLPEGFQKSEFLLKHGAIDMIVPRSKLRPIIAQLLAKFLHLPDALQVQKSK